MAGISVLMILSFIIFFSLTRESMVKIIKKDRLRIEVHLQIIAYIWTKKDNSDNANKSKRKKRFSKEKRDRIIAAIRRVIRKGEVRVNRLALPYDEGNFDKASVLRPVRYRILAYTLIAYLSTKTNRLTLRDDAIILSPDIDNLQYELTVKCRQYELLYALWTLYIGILKEKRQVKKDYVRE
nr:hypothetical protein [Oscillospiraceae bacterium]